MLDAAHRLAMASPDGRFSPDEVVRLLAAAGSRYAVNTIRTHVVSRMCVNAPAHHGTRYPDLIRDSDGRYRINDQPVGSKTSGPSLTVITVDHAPPTAEPRPTDVEAAGSSRVQQAAEAVILGLLSGMLSIVLAPTRLHLPAGEYVDVDGVAADPPVLVEVWAHQGRPKVAQKHKVLADALKRIHVGDQLDQGHRRILCFSDDAAAAPFTGRTWYAAALRAYRVDVIVVDLPADWRTRIRDAQQAQFR